MTGRKVDAHAQSRQITETVFYPDHDPRKASAEYTRTHRQLINERDEPCWVCGVRKSTLSDPAQNPAGATQLETHHWNVEWALANGLSVDKLVADFPAIGVADEAHVRAWLDSEGNMLVLCDVHHRHPLYGIHLITYPAWVSQRWEAPGWDLVTGPHDD